MCLRIFAIVQLIRVPYRNDLEQSDLHVLPAAMLYLHTVFVLSEMPHPPEGTRASPGLSQHVHSKKCVTTFLIMSERTVSTVVVLVHVPYST